MNTTLQQLIVERIQREGPITFADYMRMALYEPEYGYYVAGPTKIGWEGDYYTSTDISTLFAHCMGRQLMQMWEQLGQPNQFVVLEQGAGRGDLAYQISSWASQEAPQFETALIYHTADIHTGKDALNFHTMTTTLEALQPDVILSNELVDAFPVHIVEKHAETLYEIYVNVQAGKLCEVHGPTSSEAVASYLDTYKIPWRTYEDGWRAEINLDALRWMEQATQLLLMQYPQTDRSNEESLVQPPAGPDTDIHYSSKRIPKRSNGNVPGPHPRRKRHGFLLTIDYGDTARLLYTAERRHGTLASYFQHQFTEKPLVRPGEQDLTAHVNFTALIQAGRRHGLQLATLTTQRQWLTDLKIYEELELVRKNDFIVLDQARASDEGQTALLKWYNLRQGVMALTARGGMGDFKILILKR